MRGSVKSTEGFEVSLGKSGRAHLEPAMLSWETRGVAALGSWRFPGCWEGKCEAVRGEKSPMQGDGRVIRLLANLVHSVRMCSLVSMFDWPHGHAHVS